MSQPTAELLIHPSARRVMERRESRSVFDWLRSDAVSDLAFSFAMFLPMVFLLQLGAIGAAGFVLATFAYAALHWRRTGEVLAPRFFLLLPPVLACVSLLWSDLPKESLKQGIEFGITVYAAMLLSSARRPDMVLRGIASAFFVFLVASLLFGGMTHVAGKELAFEGLAHSKNLMADMAATGFLFALGAAWLSLRARSWWWGAAMALAAMLALPLMLQAKSAGAVLALGAGLAAFASLALLRVLPGVVRGLAIALLAALLVPVALFQRQITDALVNYVSVAFNKDTTLTGRTYLWERGYELVREQAILGRGFGSFWQQGNLDAEGMWRYAGVQSRGGFTFHNTVLEILVQLGWLGLITFALVLLVGFICLAARFVRRPNRALCVWGGVLVYELVRMPIESIGYNPFYFSTVLIAGALAMAFSPPFEEAERTPEVSVRRRFQPRPRPA